MYVATSATKIIPVTTTVAMAITTTHSSVECGPAFLSDVVVVVVVAAVVVVVAAVVVVLLLFCCCFVVAAVAGDDGCLPGRRLCSAKSIRCQTSDAPIQQKL